MTIIKLPYCQEKSPLLGGFVWSAIWFSIYSAWIQSARLQWNSLLPARDMPSVVASCLDSGSWPGVANASLPGKFPGAAKVGLHTLSLLEALTSGSWGSWVGPLPLWVSAPLLTKQSYPSYLVPQGAQIPRGLDQHLTEQVRNEINHFGFSLL